jgi:hypothetical protein
MQKSEKNTEFIDLSNVANRRNSRYEEYDQLRTMIELNDDSNYPVVNIKTTTIYKILYDQSRMKYEQMLEENWWDQFYKSLPKNQVKIEKI